MVQIKYCLALGMKFITPSIANKALHTDKFSGERGIMFNSTMKNFLLSTLVLLFVVGCNNDKQPSELVRTIEKGSSYIVKTYGWRSTFDYAQNSHFTLVLFESDVQSEPASKLIIVANEVAELMFEAKPPTINVLVVGEKSE